MCSTGNLQKLFISLIFLFDLPRGIFTDKCYCSLTSKLYSSLKCSLETTTNSDYQNVFCFQNDQNFVQIGDKEKIQGIAPWGLSSLNNTESLQINLNIGRFGVQALAGLKNLTTLNLMHSITNMESCSLAHLCSLKKINLNCADKFPKFITLMHQFKTFRLSNCYPIKLQTYCVKCKQNPNIHVIRFRQGPMLSKYSVHISSDQCFEQACSSEEMCLGNSQLQAVLKYKNCIIDSTGSPTLDNKSEKDATTISHKLNNSSRNNNFNNTITFSTYPVTKLPIISDKNDNNFIEIKPATISSTTRINNRNFTEVTSQAPTKLISTVTDGSSTPPANNTYVTTSSNMTSPATRTTAHKATQPAIISKDDEKTSQQNKNSAGNSSPSAKQDDILSSKITLAIACSLAFTVGIIIGSVSTLVFLLKFKSIMKSKASIHSDAITREELQPL